MTTMTSILFYSSLISLKAMLHIVLILCFESVKN